MKYPRESCGYIDDPAEGDEAGETPAPTAFAGIPDTGFCPVRGARTRDFVPSED